VIVSGTIGDHGIAIMSQREGLEFSASLRSDCAPLNKLVAAMLEASREIHCLRDPTRGGLATTLNEFAAQSGVGILIHEDRIPIHDAVRGACEMLGLDPLHVANEGKLVAVVSEADAEKVLACMKGHPYGAGAAIIGEVRAEHPGRVVMRTLLGTSRLVDMLVGDLLPKDMLTSWFSSPSPKARQSGSGLAWGGSVRARGFGCQSHQRAPFGAESTGWGHLFPPLDRVCHRHCRRRDRCSHLYPGSTLLARVPWI